MIQNTPGQGAARSLAVLLEQGPHQLKVVGILKWLQIHHLFVHPHFEVPVLIEDKGPAAAHPRAKVAPGPAQHDGDASGHILAAVIAGSFHDSMRAAIANAEPLSSLAPKERFSTRCPVESHVADKDVLFRHEGRLLGRVDDNFAAGKALAHVVIRVAFQGEAYSARQERAEALAGRSREHEPDRILRQAFGAVLSGQVATQDSSHRPIHIADRHLDDDGLRLPQRRGYKGKQLLIKHIRYPVILFGNAVDRHFRPYLRPVENSAEVEAPGLVVSYGIFHVEHFTVTHHILDRAESELRHQLAHLLGDEPKEVDHVLRSALELLPELRVLRRNAYGTGILVADAHHDTSHDDERRGGKSILLRSEQSSDHHVTPRLQLAVRLHDDPVAQLI